MKEKNHIIVCKKYCQKSKKEKTQTKKNKLYKNLQYYFKIWRLLLFVIV